MKASILLLRPRAKKPIVINDEFDGTSDTEANDVDAFKKEKIALATNGTEAGNGLTTMDDNATLNSVEKPSLAAMKEEDDDADQPKSPLPPQDYSFSNKRLCERWLDNLFMVLYEVCFRPSFLKTLSHYGVTSYHQPIGSEDMDHLPCRSRTLQNTTRLLSQDGTRMGDLS